MIFIMKSMKFRNICHFKFSEKQTLNIKYFPSRQIWKIEGAASFNSYKFILKFNKLRNLFPTDCAIYPNIRMSLNTVKSSAPSHKWKAIRDMVQSNHKVTPRCKKKSYKLRC